MSCGKSKEERVTGESELRRAGIHIISLADRPEMKDRAAGWFHEKWGIPLAAYVESMEECLAGNGPVPQWFLAVSGEGQEIVGGLGVIENDFHNRRDLTPNVCAVYTEEARRREGATVFLSSHVLYEVQRYCDRAAIIREGRLVAEGTTAELDIENRFFDYYEGRVTS